MYNNLVLDVIKPNNIKIKFMNQNIINKQKIIYTIYSNNR